MKSETLTPQDVALYLARNPRRKRDGRKRVRPGKSPDADLADDLLRNFSVRRLHAALMDKGKPIDIEWCVKKLLSIFYGSDQQRDRLAVLDRFQDLILLGAVQDTGLCESLKGQASKPVGVDPFAGDGQKLKLRKRA